MGEKGVRNQNLKRIRKFRVNRSLGTFTCPHGRAKAIQGPFFRVPGALVPQEHPDGPHRGLGHHPRWSRHSFNNEADGPLFASGRLTLKLEKDLMRLPHCGLVGKTCAHKLMWDMWSNWALQPAYQDLPHKTSSEIHQMRRLFDRTPKPHMDLESWSWKKYDKPPRDRWRWGPQETPRGPQCLMLSEFWMGPDGEPLEPPDLWCNGVRSLG